jgi:hypothetical protein
VSGSELRVVFGVASREVTRLAPLGAEEVGLAARLAEHVGARVQAWSGDAPCERVAGPDPLAASPGFERVELRLRCPQAHGLRIRIAAFFDVAPDHVHFARVRGAEGRTVEYLFTAGRQELALESGADGVQAGRGETLGGYVRLGVEHIAGGTDHLAFLLALLLLCERLRDVLWIATGFTLGHALTLTLAVLGLVRPDAGLVESLIGFTIALAAAESAAARSGASRRLGVALAIGLGGLALASALGAKGPPALVLAGLALFSGCATSLADTPARARRIRPLLTLAFGLVHGLGFASQLLAVGVPSDRLLAALLGFNLGVELGQLAIAASLWALGALVLARWPTLPRKFALELTTASLCGLGLYWFTARGWN